jgi:hypothetical protein
MRSGLERQMVQGQVEEMLDLLQTNLDLQAAATLMSAPASGRSGSRLPDVAWLLTAAEQSESEGKGKEKVVEKKDEEVKRLRKRKEVIVIDPGRSRLPAYNVAATDVRILSQCCLVAEELRWAGA